MRLRMLRTFAVSVWVAVALAVGTPPEAGAQTTTGKVSGTIADATTNEPLPGANVVILGTRRGATTNVNGEYFIINLSPGVYTVQASMVGYQSVATTDVNVSVDRTTTVNFRLREASVELEELRVTADRPPVEMDVSFTQTILGAGEIQAAPVGSRLRDAFATQVGMDQDDWGLTIRGSNEEELLYNLDGVGQRDNRNSRPFSSYSQTALQEVQILTGGFNAEYDNVRSGVVNIVSKEPRQWMASADVRWSPKAQKHFGPALHSEDNYWDVGRFQSMGPTGDRDNDGKIDFAGWNTAYQGLNAGVFGDAITTPQQAKAVWDWQHRQIPDNFQQNLDAKDRDSDYTYDLTVGGPIVRDRLSFLVSSRRERNAYAWGMAVPNYRDQTWQTRLIYTPTATTKLNLGFVRGWSEGGRYGDFLGQYARSAVAEADNYRDRNVFAMGSGSTIQTITRRHGNMTWTHTLSPKTFYNISGRFGKTNWLASWQPFQRRGIPVAAAFPDGTIQEISESGADAARAAGAIVLDEAPLGFTYRPTQRDILGLYQVSGGSGNPARAGDWSFMYDTDVTVDMTSQITPNHQIKAGFQLHSFWLREIRGYISSIQDPSRAEFDFVPEGGFDDPPNLKVSDTANFHNYWVRNALYGGLFLQDRMEYRQIVVNAGLRLDYHKPAKYFDLPNEQHADWMGNNAVALYAAAEKVQPPTKWALSPRLGISHPITAESKLYFNYGHFVQVPTTDQLYRTQSGLGEPLETLGNPWMEFPLTIAYEVGYERNVARDYLINGTVYFKDIEKEVDEGARLYVNNSTGRRTSFSHNGQVKDQRGIELSARKGRGRFLTGYFSYDYRVDRRRLVGWRLIYDVKTTSAIPERRIEDSPSGANPRFKARPIWKAGFNVRTPLNYGGEQAMWKGGWEANLFFRNEAGAWFNYNPGNDPALRDIDNAQWKDERRLDFRLSKSFDVAGAPLVYLEIQNLFDWRIPITSANNRIFAHLDASQSTSFRRYMEALGWTVDSSGKLNEGDKPGKYLPDSQGGPRRDYLAYWGRRDIHFGVRLSF